MNCLRCLSFDCPLIGLALFITLFITACDQQTTTLPSVSPGEVLRFTGTWSATGSHQTMQLESGHHARIFKLTGSLLLTGQQRPRKGFKAEVIGFFDNQIGMQGRCVWTDNQGEKVFSELNSKGKVPGELIEGRIFGGTGRYGSVTGEYTFRWKRMINNKNGEVSGRVVDLKGWVLAGASDTLPAITGDQK